MGNSQILLDVVDGLGPRVLESRSLESRGCWLEKGFGQAFDRRLKAWGSFFGSHADRLQELISGEAPKCQGRGLDQSQAMPFQRQTKPESKRIYSVNVCGKGPYAHKNIFLTTGHAGVSKHQQVSSCLFVQAVRRLFDRIDRGGDGHST